MGLIHKYQLSSIDLLFWPNVRLSGCGAKQTLIEEQTLKLPFHKIHATAPQSAGAFVYAQHGYELGGASPLSVTTCSLYGAATTSERQGQSREAMSKGSRPQSDEPTNRNAIEG